MILPVGLWIAEHAGRLIRTNAAGQTVWGAKPHVGPQRYGVFTARRLPSSQPMAPDNWALAHNLNDGITVIDELSAIDAFEGVPRTMLKHRQTRHQRGDDRLAGSGDTERSQGGRHQLPNSRIVDLADLVSDNAHLLGRHVAEHICCRIITCAGAPCMYMAPARIERALTNLAENSWDAIDGTGPSRSVLHA